MMARRIKEEVELELGATGQTTTPNRVEAQHVPIIKLDQRTTQRTTPQQHQAEGHPWNPHGTTTQRGIKS